MSAVAEIASRLHDIGKVSAKYQSYIAGEAGNRGPDHSTAGARVVLDHYGSELARIIAYAVAGHHAGLANGRMGRVRSALDTKLASAR